MINKSKIHAYHQIWYVNKQHLSNDAKREVLNWKEIDIKQFNVESQIEYYKIIDYIKRYPIGDIKDLLRTL